MGDKEISKRIRTQDWPAVEKAPAFLFDGTAIGEGLIAKRNILKNEIVCVYPGRRIRGDQLDEELAKMGTDEQDLAMSYLQEIQSAGTGLPGVLVLAHEPNIQGYGHLINHSPHERCRNIKQRTKAIKISIDGNRERAVCLLLYASKKISKGEPLYRDYGKLYCWPGGKVVCPKCGKEEVTKSSRK
jgi:hypothetical protein